jgi:hypothetical protein
MGDLDRVCGTVNAMTSEPPRERIANDKDSRFPEECAKALSGTWNPKTENDIEMRKS